MKTTGPGEVSRRLTYEPALDGLRAIALLGVIAYHAGIAQLRGGFLGVSSFFTLSGFLITSLLLVEQAESGRIALPRFWIRRLKRLLPAAMLTIVVTLVLASVIADDSQLARLRVDALASLFHFSNWRFIAGGDSYGALFESPSFFRHFWSLAVEEQFYVIFPSALAGALRAFGGATRRFAIALWLLGTFAVFWPAALLAGGASTDRLYFGTDTRLGELVAGALLAYWWVRRGRRVPDRPVPLTGAAVAAMGVVAWMWATAEPTDRSLYRGGLALHAALTIVIIVAAVAPTGPIRRILAFEPLRRLGIVSYGAYLFHWPVLLWLQQKTSLGPEARFGVGLGITLALAYVSHRAFELPIRRFPVVSARRLVWVVIPASLAVAVLIVGVTVWRQPADAPVDFAAVQDELDELISDGSSPASTSTPTSTPSIDAERPLRIAAFGDSTALLTGLGIAMWAEDHPADLTMVVGQAKLGCGLVTGGLRHLEDRTVPVPSECDPWLAEWIDAISDDPVDVSLVQVGAWDIVDHQVDADGPFLHIGDGTYDDLLRDRLDAAITGLLAHSDVVAIVANPDVGQGRLDAVPAGAVYPEYDPARSASWRALVDEVAAANDNVVVVDMASWVDAHPDDRRLRPDGVHFTDESTREVADWLAPEIISLHADWVEERDDTPVPSSDATTETVNVILVGDSLMADSAPAIEAALAAADEPFETRFQAMSAFPRSAEATHWWRFFIEAEQPDVVIVFVGWWEAAASAQAEPPLGDPGFPAAYRAEVLAPWFDHLSSTGIHVIDLGMAPIRDPGADARVQVTVDAAEQEAAGRDDVDFVRTALAVAPDGYTDVLPDPITGVDERVRRIGGLHLCPDGAERVADLVLERLARVVAVTPSDVWRTGLWRTDTPVDLALECPPLG